MLDPEAPLLDLHVARLADLREAWLDDFAEGGVFVPGLVPVPNWTRVLVRVRVDEVPGVETLLSGVVVFRHTRPGLGPETPADVRAPARASPRQVTGAGVAFDVSMRPRVVFLERAARGVLPERARRSPRWPLHAYGEIVLRPDERAREVEIVDVGDHGAQLVLPDGPGFVVRGAPVRLWVAFAPSGEASFAPVSGRVAWIASDGERLGVELALEAEGARLHWSRVVGRARGALDRRAPRPSASRMLAVR